MINLANRLIVVSLCFMYSGAFLVEREDFDEFCGLMNTFIDQGISINMDERSALETFNDLLHRTSVGLESNSNLNWLATLFQSAFQSQNVNVKLEGTNKTEVHVIGKREAQELIPCSLLPFPSSIDTEDEQSVEMAIMSIQNFLEEYYGH